VEVRNKKEKAMARHGGRCKGFAAEMGVWETHYNEGK
jgi:hypothetical protein